MKNFPKHFMPFLLLALIPFFAFESCKKDEDPVLPVPVPETNDRGDIVSTKSIGTYTPASIQQILDASGTELPFALTHSVKVLSVNYYTINSAGEQIIASGAFCIPQGVNNLPLMSIQHGTETKRNLVASVSPNNSTEGLISLITASLGYVTAVPDYPGFGVSDVMHPYTHAKSLVPCVIDFMLACKTYTLENNIDLNGQVFLTGYSEGGYASLLVQKKIEQDYFNEFKLTAVAPMSGPYDLKGMAEKIFEDVSYSTPAYVAFLLTSYNNIYGWNRLDDFFSSSYSSKMPGLFDGTKTWGEIVGQLPSAISELLKADFIESFNAGNEPDLLAALEENTMLDWKPKTPMHFFHGDADEIVPIQNTYTAMESFKANGAIDMQLTTIPGGNHDTSGPYAIIGAIQWFESM